MQSTKGALSGALSLRRLSLLLRRDFSGGYKGVIIAMAAVGGLIILSSLVSALSRELSPMHPTLYVQLLFIGGFVVTSLSFKELHLNGQSVFYLTLPGSALEKFLSKLLVTSLGYAIGSLAFYTAVSAAAEGINHLIFGYGHPLFNPFDRNILLAVAVYLVSQSVFLVGSVYFRRLAFIKTALSVVLFGILLSFVTGIAVWLIFRDYAEGRRILFEPYLNELARTGDMEMVLRPLAEGFTLAAKIVFWTAVAPVGWVVSYLRLRETEV